MSIHATKPRTMGDVAIAVAAAAKEAGKIISFSPIGHCEQLGRDFIRMGWADRNQSIHTVYLPAPASSPAREGSVGDFMRNAGFKMKDVVGNGAPVFSGAVPRAIAHDACTAK